MRRIPSDEITSFPHALNLLFCVPRHSCEQWERRWLHREEGSGNGATEAFPVIAFMMDCDRPLIDPAASPWVSRPKARLLLMVEMDSTIGDVAAGDRVAEDVASRKVKTR